MVNALYALRDPYNYANVDVYFDGQLLGGYQATATFFAWYLFTTGRNRLIWTAPGIRSGNILYLPSRRGFSAPPGPQQIRYTGGSPTMLDWLGRPIAPFIVPINPL